MATPAAILNLAVVANTASANTALAGTQARLRAVAGTSVKTNAVMKKAMLGVGAAAVGAAAALYKIGEAFDDSYDTIRTQTGATGKEMAKLKRSFRDVVRSVPADFDTAAKAVAGVQQRLDATGKPLGRLSKQFAELSRITGTDIDSNITSVSRAFKDWEVRTRRQSGQLDKFFRASQESGASVDDLAQSVVQFGAPLRQLGFSLDEATAMFAAFEEAGVNTQTMMPGLRFALRSFMEQGLDPTKELQATFKGIADGTLEAQKAFEIFGGRATPDMIEAIKQGRFELDKMTSSLAKGDETIRGSGRETMDFTEHWQQFKNLLALELEPVAKRVFEGLADLMRDVTKAFKRDGLGGALRVLIQKFNDALPKFAEFGGKIVKAIGEGFLDAPAWARLATGAWVGAKLFGKGGPDATGREMGKRLGRGIVVGILIALPTLLVDMVKWLDERRFKIQQMGADIGEWFVNGLIDAVNLGIRTINDVMDKANIAAFAGVDAPNIGEIGKVDFQGPIEAAEAARKELRHIAHGIQKDWQGGWMGMADTAEDSSTSAWHHWRDSLGKIADRGVNQGGRFETALERAFEGVSGSANREGGDAFKHWRDWLDQTKSMGDTKTTTFKQDVSGNFRSLASASIGAIASLASETQKTLSSLKVKDQIYVSSKGGNQETVKAQKGAVIVPGSGSGDKVPALLEPGEVVINRKAAAAMGGAQKVNRLNKMVPRFAGGGIVQQALGPYAIPPIAYDANHAGGNSHLHLDFFTKSQAVSVGRKMQDMGWSIGEYSGNVPGFGPVTVQHQSPGHYDGTAFDANKGVVEARSDVAAIARLLGGKGGGVIGGAAAKRLGRVLLNGPAGPLLSGGQAAIDMVRSAANKFIGNKAPMEGAERGANVAVGAGAVSRPEMRKLLSAHGMPNWTGWIALAESGLDPNAHNASGASGLWQIMMPLHAGIVKGNVFDPNVNTAAAKVLWNQSGSTPWNPSKYAGAIPEGWGPHQGQAFRKGGIAKLAGGAVVGPGGGTGSGSAPWAKLLTRLKKLRGKTPFIEERIANAQILDTLSTSPAGAELSSGELSGQIGLGQALLSNLTQRAGGIGRVLKMLPKKDKRRKGLLSELTGLQGITGQGGSILQAKQALDALMSTGVGGGIDYEQIAALRGQLLQQANQRYGVSQAQYGVFNGSASSPADVRITFYEGSRDAQVSVNGTKQNVSTMVEQSLRRTGQRVLPGSGGY
jgi:TP901 family phage tail tape measure protein